MDRWIGGAGVGVRGLGRVWDVGLWVCWGDGGEVWVEVVGGREGGGGRGGWGGWVFEVVRAGS